jgi:hypothetical protein
MTPQLRDQDGHRVDETADGFECTESGCRPRRVVDLANGTVVWERESDV